MASPGRLAISWIMPSSAITKMPAVPVIDIFAGPGGLGEGFSAFRSGVTSPFDVRLSIEKEPVACATLTLRKFFRQFEEAPPELQAYIQRRAPLSEAYLAHPTEAQRANTGVWNAELGKVSPKSVASCIRASLSGSSDWVLLGGPPCQAYSIAGRSRMRSTRPDFENDERHFLYREYLRIVADHEPAVFVLENVKGLLTSRHGGTKIVTRILDDLSAPARALDRTRTDGRSYRLYPLSQRQASLPWMGEGLQDGEEFLLKAEEFGIPQMRHRIFIIGVRSDVSGRPAPLNYSPEITAGQVLTDLPPIRSRLTKEVDSFKNWCNAIKAIRDHEWMTERDSRLTPVAKEIRRTIPDLGRTSLDFGAEYLPFRRLPSTLGAWYRDNSVGLTHHESRAHMRSDLHRYLFTSAYGIAHGRSPELQDFPKELRPAHKNVNRALEDGGIFNDRFRVQLRDRPSSTITSHISKDGHYYIHYDPLQCRSLTVREAARLQTFPDNYFFEGNRTEQYHQVGNAVPPLLAREIARVVHELLVAARITVPTAMVLKTRRAKTPARPAA
jgi:DNA (cytosine-5)-methyltransferase 1